MNTDNDIILVPPYLLKIRHIIHFSTYHRESTYSDSKMHKQIAIWHIEINNVPNRNSYCQ